MRPVCTDDFSTVYTTLAHDLMKEKHKDLTLRLDSASSWSFLTNLISMNFYGSSQGLPGAGAMLDSYTFMWTNFVKEY